MKLLSSAFGNFEDIPTKYTGEGQDISPPLRWEEAPEETRSFALIMDDPDAPHGTWDHWVIYNLPPTTRELTEAIKDLPPNTQSGLNTGGTTTYIGPNPPSGTHRYFFKLYALDTLLQLAQGITKTDLLKAMNGHILSDAFLVGHYRRKDGGDV
jgi:Raf kinase inhibitor-like YbhB/YbcL family protein